MPEDAWLFLGIIIFWFGGTIVNGLIAEEKQRSVWGALFLSFFLSPLFVYLYLLAVPPKAPR